MYACTVGFSPDGRSSSTGGSSRADELGEEAALGKKLVDQDGADRVRLLVRLEVEQVVRHGPPHAHRLVRLAGVGGDDVLEDRLDGLRHVGVGDGDEVVVHGCCSSGDPRLSVVRSTVGNLFARNCACNLLNIPYLGIV